MLSNCENSILSLKIASKFNFSSSFVDYRIWHAFGYEINMGDIVLEKGGGICGFKLNPDLALSSVGFKF